LKGISAYRLRDYKTSTPIFKQLVSIDSKNDNYRNWFSQSTYQHKLWISKTIAIVSTGILFIGLLFKQQITSHSIRVFIDLTAVMGLFGTLIYDYFMKRNFRKVQSKL
jgi:hypothetical protein